MSPEQAESVGAGRGHAERRVLAGRAALRAADGHDAAGARRGCGEAGYAEILRRIREEEPPRPSTRLSDSGDRWRRSRRAAATEPARLTRLVRGELDWIAMKALEKDRTRRYETANGLARDIERYLEGEAVEAWAAVGAVPIEQVCADGTGGAGDGGGVCR